MNINWSELGRGYLEELEKKANTPALPAPAVGNVAAGAAKAVAPGLLRTAGSTVLKSLPVVGNVVSGGLAVNDLAHGRWVDAGLNALGAIPGLGTGTQLAIGAAQIGKGAWDAGAGRWLGNKWQNFKDSVNPFSGVSDAMSGLGTAIKGMAPIALPLLLANRGGGGGGQQPMNININTGKPPTMLDYDQQGVNSFSKFAHFKLADVVTEALANAAKRRMANVVIDQMIPPPEQDKHKQTAELDITSKYPEMEKLLADQQNKAYLRRLLSEQS